MQYLLPAISTCHENTLCSPDTDFSQDPKGHREIWKQ